MAGTVRDNSLNGQIVANYRVGRQIGRGGMGAVYEAVHQYLGRRAALKVLHTQFSQTPELTARFVNEARAANAVQHPSVVSVFEIGQLADGTRYILMEYLDGPPLSQRIRELAAAQEAAASTGREAGVRVLTSMRLVRQLASALRALHDKGVIHRDLKPDNILIVKDPETPGGERAKLLDFGIAKFVSEYGRIEEAPFPGVPAYVKTALGALLGTPMYMGPELWRGKGNVDAQADVYSLGCILFELLTGRPPYCASAIAQLMHMHVWQKPPPSLLSRPDIPGSLADLTLQMLAKEPGDRPSTSEVEARLEQLITAVTPLEAAPSKADAATIVLRKSSPNQEVRSCEPEDDDETKPLQRVALLARPMTMTVIPTLDPQDVMISGASSRIGAVPQNLALGLKVSAEPQAGEPRPGAPPVAVGEGAPRSAPGAVASPVGTSLPGRSPSGSAQLIPLPRISGKIGPIALASILLAVVSWQLVSLHRSYRICNLPLDKPASALEWSMELDSVPTAAEVFDKETGQRLGSTPYHVSQPSPDARKLILRKENYRPRVIIPDLDGGPWKLIIHMNKAAKRKKF